MGKFTAALMVGLLVVSSRAQSEETRQILARSGTWFAMAHRPSGTSAPDLCAAADTASGLLFRTDQDGSTFRIMNEKWSLPSDIEGAVQVSIGDWSKSWVVTANTNNMVEMVIFPAEIVDMIDRMDKASSMTTVIGKDRVTSSLSGSTVVTNAYRTCAGFKGSSALPGANPFR
jgi:hypothetical protein